MKKNFKILESPEDCRALLKHAGQKWIEVRGSRIPIEEATDIQVAMAAASRILVHPKGVAAMSPERRAKICRSGGLAVSKNKEHMREIGRKGGLKTSRDLEYMRELGRNSWLSGKRKK